MISSSRVVAAPNIRHQHRETERHGCRTTTPHLRSADPADSARRGCWLPVQPECSAWAWPHPRRVLLTGPRLREPMEAPYTDDAWYFPLPYLPSPEYPLYPAPEPELPTVVEPTDTSGAATAPSSTPAPSTHLRLFKPTTGKPRRPRHRRPTRDPARSRTTQIRRPPTALIRLKARPKNSGLSGCSRRPSRTSARCWPMTTARCSCPASACRSTRATTSTTSSVPATHGSCSTTGTRRPPTGPARWLVPSLEPAR